MAERFQGYLIQNPKGEGKKCHRALPVYQKFSCPFSPASQFSRLSPTVLLKEQYLRILFQPGKCETPLCTFCTLVNGTLCHILWEF